MTGPGVHSSRAETKAHQPVGNAPPNRGNPALCRSTLGIFPADFSRTAAALAMRKLAVTSAAGDPTGTVRTATQVSRGHHRGKNRIID
jgi:hypothetical protein